MITDRKADEPTMRSIDSVAFRTLEQAVRFYGIRALLIALEDICDQHAKTCAGNYNTVQAKQWGQWAAEIDELADEPAFVDPGRE